MPLLVFVDGILHDGTAVWKLNAALAFWKIRIKIIKYHPVRMRVAHAL